jgi:hypothetical protein
VNRGGVMWAAVVIFCALWWAVFVLVVGVPLVLA